MNCAEMLCRAVAAQPEKTALLQDETQLSYGALDRRTNRLANALAGLGIGPGDRVAVLIRNDLRYVEAMYGIHRLGAVAVPVTTRAVYPTLRHIVCDSGACALIASAGFAAEARRLGEDVATLAHVRILDDADGERDYDTWRDAAADTPVLVAADPGAPAMLCYKIGRASCRERV